MDLYEPTKKALELIKPHLIKGSVIGFDELNLSLYPGETLAVKEFFNLNKCKFVKPKGSRQLSYMIFNGE